MQTVIFLLEVRMENLPRVYLSECLSSKSLTADIWLFVFIKHLTNDKLIFINDTNIITSDTQGNKKWF
jgi:hypothetical protein